MERPPLPRKRDRGFEGLARLGDSADCYMRHAEIVMRFRKISLQGERALVLCDRLLAAIERVERVGEIVVRLGIIGLQGDRCLKVPYRLLVIADGLQHDSE